MAVKIIILIDDFRVIFSINFFVYKNCKEILITVPQSDFRLLLLSKPPKTLHSLS